MREPVLPSEEKKNMTAVFITTCPSGYVYNINGRRYFYLTKAMEDGTINDRQATEIIKKTLPVGEQSLEISEDS